MRGTQTAFHHKCFIYRKKIKWIIKTLNNLLKGQVKLQMIYLTCLTFKKSLKKKSQPE